MIFLILDSFDVMKSLIFNSKILESFLEWYKKNKPIGNKIILDIQAANSAEIMSSLAHLIPKIFKT